jgi:hypothetical protein
LVITRAPTHAYKGPFRGCGDPSLHWTVKSRPAPGIVLMAHFLNQLPRNLLKSDRSGAVKKRLKAKTPVKSFDGDFFNHKSSTGGLFDFEAPL